MIGRRNLLTSSVAASLMGLTAAAGEAAAAPLDADDGQLTSRDVDELGRAISGIRDEMRGQHSFTEISVLRGLQKQHLLATGKFPDFIDVGIDLWFDVYDWHVRWQQPFAMGRDAQNRRTILLFETQIVLRLDLGNRYMSQPYDKP